MQISISNIIGRNSGARSDKNVPTNTILPVISGNISIGSTLTSTTGTWFSDTGITSYFYQWYRNGIIIPGETLSTHVLTTSDSLYNITCKVAAADSDGTSTYVSSNSIFINSLFEFKARVFADTGTYSAESCQIATLTTLNNI